MLRDSKGLKITLLAIVLIVMFINFLPGDTYPAKQEVVASTKDVYDLTVKATVGDISVIVDPNATQISASYSGSGRTRSKLLLEQNGSSVTVSEKYSENGFLHFFNFTSTPRMMVVVPQGAMLEALTISTVSGDISIDSDLTVGRIKLASASGEIDFLNLKAPGGTAQIATVSGNVDGYSVAADKVKVATTSGDIDVYRVEGNDIDLNSVSGSISCETASGNGNVKLTTVSGTIDMELDERTNATVSATSLSGSIQLGQSDSRSFEKSATAVVGNGTGSINAKTTSGSITISW